MFDRGLYARLRRIESSLLNLQLLEEGRLERETKDGGRPTMLDPRLYAYLRRIESSLLNRQLLEEDHLERETKDGGGLTIFIPNWNHRTVLPRALRSALDALEPLEKEGFSAEILVIDDASRDGSQKLLRTAQALYNEPRLKTLCLRRNYGQHHLCNLALRTSRFKYVCRVDADNELAPNNLPLFLRSILETEATMVYGTLIVMENGEAVGTRSNMTASLHLTKGNYIDAFSIVDAEKISRVGGYTRIHPYSAEDWEMLLHLIGEEHEILLVPAVLGYYHIHPLSASGELKLTAEGHAAMRRVYAQSGTLEWDNTRVGRIYHPDVGFMDEW
jgi:glycosyltransferase involved in cell wall biosynthesis